MNLAIGTTGVQLPNILSVNTNYLLELDRRCKGTQFQGGQHTTSMYDRQSRPSVHLPLSDEVVIDACEFMHAIYDDLSQINEMLSLNSPSL